MDRQDARRYSDNIRGEVDGAFLYRRLADLTEDPRLREIYTRLAEAEERHAVFWEAKLTAGGAKVPLRRVSWRARLLAWAGGRMGSSTILSAVAGNEHRGRRMYDAQPEAAGSALPGEERSHARLLSVLSGSGGLQGPAIARLEGRHRAVGGNALRAAVLGANDGLVSNMSLVMGVAGATDGGGGVLIAGLAGLLAGGFSMALGEWLSVQSSRELNAAEIEAEAEELAEVPDEEAEELALIYQAKGLPEDMAERMANEIIANPQAALDTLAREELGIDPETLGGSALQAAVASFSLFVSGAIVPVLPFIFARGMAAVIASIAASTVALFLIGAAITIVTGTGLWRSGFRQVAFGLAAAAITYGVGLGLGTAIGG